MDATPPTRRVSSARRTTASPTSVPSTGISPPQLVVIHLVLAGMGLAACALPKSPVIMLTVVATVAVWIVNLRKEGFDAVALERLLDRPWVLYPTVAALLLLAFAWIDGTFGVRAAVFGWGILLGGELTRRFCGRYGALSLPWNRNERWFNLAAYWVGSAAFALPLLLIGVGDWFTNWLQSGRVRYLVVTLIVVGVVRTLPLAIRPAVLAPLIGAMSVAAMLFNTMSLEQSPTVPWHRAFSWLMVIVVYAATALALTAVRLGKGYPIVLAGLWLTAVLIGFTFPIGLGPFIGLVDQTFSDGLAFAIPVYLAAACGVFYLKSELFRSASDDRTAEESLTIIVGLGIAAMYGATLCRLGMARNPVGPLLMVGSLAGGGAALATVVWKSQWLSRKDGGSSETIRFLAVWTGAGLVAAAAWISPVITVTVALSSFIAAILVAMLLPLTTGRRDVGVVGEVLGVAVLSALAAHLIGHLYYWITS